MTSKSLNTFFSEVGLSQTKLKKLSFGYERSNKCFNLTKPLFSSTVSIDQFPERSPGGFLSIPEEGMIKGIQKLVKMSPKLMGLNIKYSRYTLEFYLLTIVSPGTVSDEGFQRVGELLSKGLPKLQELSINWQATFP